MPPTELTLPQAYRHCTQIARQHYENFPTASRLIRRELRPAVAAIYAFARHADDIADEGECTPGKRLKRLDAWETLLDRCVAGEVGHPVFLALGDAIRRHDLPVAPLRDLLTAFRMDVSIHSYATVDELLFYCRHSANPVGRLVLALHRIEEPRAIVASDAICTALQLANFWQDLSVDLPRGRCYLPEDWLRKAGLDSAALLAGGGDAEALAPALTEAVHYTRALFEEGRAILSHLPLRLRLQIAATIHGGRAILRATEANPDPLKTRPRLGRGDWLRLAPGVLHDGFAPPAAAPEFA